MIQDRIQKVSENPVQKTKKMPAISLLQLILLLFMTISCAIPSPIETSVRNEKTHDLSLEAVLRDPSLYKGETVIWGGVIYRSEKRNGSTALFVEETPFDFRGRPKNIEFSEGLFMARTSENLDTDAYAAGRKITIAGEISGEELGNYRNTPYVYPVITIKEKHLWRVDSPPLQWNWGKTPYYWPDEYTPDQERRSMP
jgi:outer membrane lipoprotein